MGITTSMMQGQELNEFRKLNTDSSDQPKIPAPSDTRHITDKKGFIIFGIVFTIFIPFLIYTLIYSDIRRLSYENDSCGNYCGIKNTKIDALTCSGKDYTDKPYQLTNIKENRKSCSADCPPSNVGKNGECYNPNDDTSDNFGNIEDEREAWKYTQKSWWKFIITIIITIILCLLMLALFRYVPQVMVWGILIISLLVTLALTCLSWYGYSTMDPNEEIRNGVLALAIVLTLFTVFAFILIGVLFKKIKLVVLLFKETAKAIFAMPFLTMLPIITMFLQLSVSGLLIVTTTWMITAAELVEIDKDHYDYVRNGVMVFAMIYNIVIVIWSLQFFAGCQYMVTSGSVASWYFTGNNRLYLKSPIWTSLTITIKYHLGTIAFGSFILTMVAVIKAAIKSLISNRKCRWIVDCCFNNVEAFLKFLSKNAYIETALHGQSFFRSGKRAAQLLTTNAASVIAINSVGDFVIGMTEFLLLVISTAISYALFSNNPNGWLPTVLSGCANIFIIVIIFAVFETTVDTLFICFCEDKVLNDGMSKPYFMPKDLMQFVENSKKLYKEKK